MKIEVWITLLTFLSFHRFVTDFIFTMPFNALVLFSVVSHAIVMVPCIALSLFSIQSSAQTSQPSSSCQRAFARTKRSCCCHLIQPNLAAYIFFVRALVRYSNCVVSILFEHIHRCETTPLHLFSKVIQTKPNTHFFRKCTFEVNRVEKKVVNDKSFVFRYDFYFIRRMTTALFFRLFRDLNFTLLVLLCMCACV